MKLKLGQPTLHLEENEISFLENTCKLLEELGCLLKYQDISLSNYYSMNDNITCAREVITDILKIAVKE